MSHRLMKALKSVGHASRIENLVASGMPDVSYCVAGREGFIENKWVGRWPLHPSTIVRLPHYTAHQRLWHRERARAGGTVWVLVGVGNPMRDYLLLEGWMAADYLGLTTKAALLERAAWASFGKGFPWDLLRESL